MTFTQEQAKQEVMNLFDKVAISYEREGTAYFRHFGAKLVDMAAPKKGDKILDVATGRGAVVLSAIKAIGLDGSATAVDLSQNMLLELQKNNSLPSNAYFFQMDAENLHFSDHLFDIVFCSFALFFFPNPKKALLEFKRVVKKEGKVAIALFTEHSFLGNFVIERSRELGALKPVAHSNPFYSTEDLEQLFLQAGYKKVTFHHEKHHVSYESVELWWDTLFSIGIRGYLEQLPKESLNILQKEAFARAEKKKINGIFTEERIAIFAIAEL